jgi:predicted permease
MSWFTRIANVFRREGIDREIDEELASHLEEALERGRTSEEARRALGGAVRHRELSRDIKLLPWLDALAADVVFGWRQLNKRRAVSLAAILSLALAMGSVTTVFRLVDALLLRTLPVAEPQRLFYLTSTYTVRDGQPGTLEYFDYPTFRRYRDAVADRANLMVMGMTAPQDVVFGAGGESEKVYRQYVSGNVFGVFGLHPALGRLIIPSDDLKPGASPVAVLSYGYWARRFARDPRVLGKSFRMDDARFEIVGVAPKGFTGTEPGDLSDIFIPATMNVEAIDKPDWSWFRIWVRPKAGYSPEQVRQPLQALFTREHLEHARHEPPGTPKQFVAAYLREKLALNPAGSGASGVQKQYRRPLLILTVLVALVLLVACANVGNLLTAQGTSRAREMALRVSIGAGPWRLMQLVLVESALLAIIAAALGTLFGWWSAPFVVSMLRVPEDPVRLVLSGGWRDPLFSFALAFLVTMLFGLAPALRASGVKPMSALRGGDEPHSRRRAMNTLLAAQMAFCILVQFVAGLFVATFERLSSRPLGFTSQHLLVMDTAASKPQPAQVWMQIADQLRETPGVQSVSIAEWPLLSMNWWTIRVRLPGHAVEALPTCALGVSPGFFDTMRMRLIAGRDFRAGDVPPRSSDSKPLRAGVGIVNEAFARRYFNGQNPAGRSVSVPATLEIVGMVNDAVYADVREPMRPTVYVPMEDPKEGTFMVRTAGDPLARAQVLSRAISKANPDFRVHTINAQEAFIRWQTLRERLLAVLSLFFAIVALVLAAIGLYGILNYAVTRQRREIGIRMALGARPVQVVQRVSGGLLGVVCLGLSIGLAAGMACGRLVESLLFEVRSTDPSAIAVPLAALLGAALLAALPPAIRAVQIDPAQTLRSE